MHLPPGHRKRVKHFDLPGHAHELTFSCYRRLPLLTDERFLLLLSRAIAAAVAKHGFHLLAFVFMPEHVHLVVFPTTPDSDIAGLLFAIKRPVSFRIKQLMEQDHDPRLEELTILERPGKTTFRFWQEGPGYDRNLDRLSTLRTSIDYLRDNPYRRQLCLHPRDWKWSSWHHYHGTPHPDLPPIDPLPMGEMAE